MASVLSWVSSVFNQKNNNQPITAKKRPRSMDNLNVAKPDPFEAPAANDATQVNQAKKQRLSLQQPQNSDNQILLNAADYASTPLNEFSKLLHAKPKIAPPAQHHDDSLIQDDPFLNFSTMANMHFSPYKLRFDNQHHILDTSNLSLEQYSQMYHSAVKSPLQPHNSFLQQDKIRVQPPRLEQAIQLRHYNTGDHAFKTPMFHAMKHLPVQEPVAPSFLHKPVQSVSVNNGIRCLFTIIFFYL